MVPRAIIGTTQRVLDHGYVTLIDVWGSEEGIIEAARQSTTGAFKGWARETLWRCTACYYTLVNTADPAGGSAPCCHHPGHGRLGYVPAESHPGDARLLAYLWKHQHHTPFEMAGMTIEVQAPIFVFREWHRHRTQSYNELSARYTPMPDVNYIPTIDRLMINAGGTNRQAGTVAGADALTGDNAAIFQNALAAQYAEAERLYQHALSAGVPKELARVILPVGRYSRMRASTDLRNWLGFLKLRNDPHAQWEIRQYAQAVERILADVFPRTLALFRA